MRISDWSSDVCSSDLPRGCRKDTLALHAWLPDLAPSTALRKAFKGGEIGFATFRQRYRDELAGHPEHWWALLEMAGRGTLDRKSVVKGKRVSVRVVLGGRGRIKKKNKLTKAK